MQTHPLMLWCTRCFAHTREWRFVEFRELTRWPVPVRSITFTPDPYRQLAGFMQCFLHNILYHVLRVGDHSHNP